MTDAEPTRYVPLDPMSNYRIDPRVQPFDPAELTVTGIVILCEYQGPVPGSQVPSMHMSMTQFVRLSDRSMIRLNMDRGVGGGQMNAQEEPVSWKSSGEEVLKEVQDLIRGDVPDRDEFPWEEYARTAQLRGISVDAETLMKLPVTVFLSDELIRMFEF
ncbi:hypothetical protein [Microbacterium sp. ZW T5_56]|uniref:hypothetical protein n=1 Tax=Microbacterium sp. ZW T5_56 TaxID=3378081 RepID=UPI003854AA36